MKYVRLGESGLKVSRLCLGCMSYGAPSERWPWALAEEQSRPFIRRALDLGINFFDTANVYSNGAGEEVLGRALVDFASRDDVVIATKVYAPMGEGPNSKGLSRKHILTQVDAQLKRLRTDHIDLYQIHRFDPDTPIEETMEALHDVVKAGKARYIGASSMSAWQFLKAQYTATLNGWTRFISMQPQYNLVYREEEREMLPMCQDLGVGVVPWSPLARGFLAGNRTRAGGATERARSDAFARQLYYTDSDFKVVDRLSEVARDRGLPNMQVALAWVLSKPVITSPIVGATRLEQLEQAVEAMSIDLTGDELRRLEEPYQPHPVMFFS